MIKTSARDLTKVCHSSIVMMWLLSAHHKICQTDKQPRKRLQKGRRGGESTHGGGSEETRAKSQKGSQFLNLKLRIPKVAY